MADVNATTDADTTVEVLIIGCGFGGICTGIKLKQAGVDDFVMLEKDDDIGGTWYANTYPGCACDVQSHLYSFSFEPNPDWSHMFARQSEIWKYQRHADLADVAVRVIQSLNSSVDPSAVVPTMSGVSSVKISVGPNPRMTSTAVS